jgi:hypothetical protein
MEAFDLAQTMAEYCDSVGQPYNLQYLLDKANEIIEDFDKGIAQDPDYV